MQPVKSLLAYFSFSERLLWSCSVLFILVSFWLFGGQDWLTLTVSLIGATSLLFIAKGNPVGQLLTVVFSLLYGYISLTFRYYGEMITYLGMTAPMAVAALVSWLRHPYKGDRAQVQVNRLAAKEPGLLALLTAAVTGVFYFILAAFGTANLLPSTLSVATSFAAVYLTCRRSPWYALAYAANDVVLVCLWVLAAMENPGYISVAVCFVMFLANDIYGFISWRRMGQRQAAGC